MPKHNPYAEESFPQPDHYHNDPDEDLMLRLEPRDDFDTFDRAEDDDDLVDATYGADDEDQPYEAEDFAEDEDEDEDDDLDPLLDEDLDEVEDELDDDFEDFEDLEG